jgi:hypothetical protein
VRAILAPTQAGDRSNIKGVAGEVVATQSLHSQHLPCGKERLRLLESGLADRRRALVRPKQEEVRSAIGTGVRLGMEPPVPRVVVFFGAVSAQRETVHGRISPVVG